MSEILGEKLEYVWVPRGYYSMAKIKDDDVKMLIAGDVDARLEKLKACYDATIKLLQADIVVIRTENKKLRSSLGKVKKE